MPPSPTPRTRSAQRDAVSDGGRLDVFLNYACQAKCPFCYNPPLTKSLIRWKLPREALARELLKAAAAGARGVTYSGGEVTLLKDLPLLLRMARKAGLREIGIISNGLRLADRGYLEELRESGLNFCCLSIHGSKAGTHDSMVAVPGAFAKANAALSHLEARGMTSVLNFVLTRRNAAEAPEFIELYASREVREFQLYFPHYDGLMAENAGTLAISYEEAAPHLRRAYQRALQAGKQDRVWIYNMPPCAMPDLKHRLRNWEREESSLLVDPQGVKSGQFHGERRSRCKLAVCRTCAMDSRCLGFESQTVSRFGIGSLSGLTAP